MALNVVKSIVKARASAQIAFEKSGGVDLIEGEIPAEKLFPPMEKLPQEEQTSELTQEAACIFCGKPHELKRSLWLTENARLIELKVSGFYYCSQVNRVFITE